MEEIEARTFLQVRHGTGFVLADGLAAVTAVLQPEADGRVAAVGGTGLVFEHSLEIGFRHCYGLAHGVAGILDRLPFFGTEHTARHDVDRVGRGDLVADQFLKFLPDALVEVLVLRCYVGIVECLLVGGDGTQAVGRRKLVAAVPACIAAGYVALVAARHQRVVVPFVGARYPAGHPAVERIGHPECNAVVQVVPEGIVAHVVIVIDHVVAEVSLPLRSLDERQLQPGGHGTRHHGFQRLLVDREGQRIGRDGGFRRERDHGLAALRSTRIFSIADGDVAAGRAGRRRYRECVARGFGRPRNVGGDGQGERAGVTADGGFGLGQGEIRLTREARAGQAGEVGFLRDDHLDAPGIFAGDTFERAAAGGDGIVLEHGILGGEQVEAAAILAFESHRAFVPGRIERLADESVFQLHVGHGHVHRFEFSAQQLFDGNLPGRGGCLAKVIHITQRQILHLDGTVRIDGKYLVLQVDAHFMSAGESLVVAVAVEHQTGFAVGDDDGLGGTVVVQAAVGIAAEVADDDSFDEDVFLDRIILARIQGADFADGLGHGRGLHIHLLRDADFLLVVDRLDGDRTRARVGGVGGNGDGHRTGAAARCGSDTDPGFGSTRIPHPLAIHREGGSPSFSRKFQRGRRYRDRQFLGCRLGLRLLARCQEQGQSGKKS